MPDTHDYLTLPDFTSITPVSALQNVLQIIVSNRAKREQLLTAEDVNFDTLIAPLETISHALHCAFSPMSHLHGVRNSPDWREAYQEALSELTRYNTELSQDSRLYEAFASIEHNASADLDEAQKKLIENTLRDFRLAGVALDEHTKKRFATIQRELSQLSTQFSQNVQDATDAWHYHCENDAELAGLPAATLTAAREFAAKNDLDGWYFNLNQPTYQAIVTHADNPALRRRVYEAWVTRASAHTDDRYDNAPLIEKIVGLRHEAATLVGFANFAEYSLASKMAETVDDVAGFLYELAKKSRAGAERELNDLRKFAGRDINAWDLAYYSEKLKHQRFGVSEELLRDYFPVDTVLDGIFALANQLYGLTIRPRTGIDAWHESVTFVDVYDRSNELIGGFYLDLYARNGKRAGAWIDECVVRKNLDNALTLPVGYLVCNFQSPGQELLATLTHSDVVTLFHEFGHMLHHLMTRVDYPSIAGINGVPWDAVELPSQFMENYAWQPEVLARISRHADTQEPLPQALYEKLVASRNFNAGLLMLRQLEYALFDLRLHTEYLPAQGARVTNILDEVREAIAVVQPPPWCQFANSFGHIFAGGYCAGYYSYKWAEVLASDAFSAFDDAGIFDAHTANRFKETILEIGGSRDILKSFIEFRGRRPSVDALLAYSGITDSR